MPPVIAGLILHGLGGVAAASFYAPLKFIRRWPWESYYLAMGLFAWQAAPWIIGYATVPNLWEVLWGAPPAALGWTLLFGALWGVGAVTYGLTMRYLGMALGMSVSLGFSALFGTLVPPLFRGQLGAIAATEGGRIVIGGVALCVAGILVSGFAGVRKDGEKPAALPANDHSGDAEFSPLKGLGVAFVCGVMSACFAFGLQAGAPVAERALAAGANPLFQNNAVLCVILVGGCFTNTLWCLYLNRRNRTFASYGATTAPQTGGILALCALSGFVWFLQFLFYGMGMTKMGAFEFSSWSLHMAFIIIVGNLWGLAFKEWRGVSRTTLSVVWCGILLLIGSTFVIGWGNSLGGTSVH